MTQSSFSNHSNASTGSSRLPSVLVMAALGFGVGETVRLTHCMKGTVRNSRTRALRAAGTDNLLITIIKGLSDGTLVIPPTGTGKLDVDKAIQAIDRATSLFEEKPPSEAALRVVLGVIRNYRTYADPGLQQEWWQASPQLGEIRTRARENNFVRNVTAMVRAGCLTYQDVRQLKPGPPFIEALRGRSLHLVGEPAPAPSGLPGAEPPPAVQETERPRPAAPPVRGAPPRAVSPVVGIIIELLAGLEDPDYTEGKLFKDWPFTLVQNNFREIMAAVNDGTIPPPQGVLELWLRRFRLRAELKAYLKAIIAGEPTSELDSRAADQLEDLRCRTPKEAAFLATWGKLL